ncbi:SDR family NAD(P)-dependent oxidoreductase [Amycolatopsis sp. NPDC059657]|uniref:SDR family NAD(P)-dependent oxidoreductase n=1 Tax=Amycolatopsis sp. NPDC059657 TaxID=3346899 RepID=UPI00366E6620
MRGVLVTGASSGIGRAVAEAFAALGDRVVLHYASNKPEPVSGDGHALVQGDLSDPGAAQRIADFAEEALGGVDVLVNNAAIATGPENAHAVPDVSYADWQRSFQETFGVNVFGTANLTYSVARNLIARGAPGRIVNIGSRGAFRGEPDHPAYGASKAALHSLGQSLAVSLAPHGIAVATVAPGFTLTSRVADRVDDELRAQSPFGRVGTAEEVAAAVVYLASSDWASGAVLDLNGASYLH